MITHKGDYFMLCHSMGTYILSEALPVLLAMEPLKKIEAIIHAGSDIEVTKFRKLGEQWEQLAERTVVLYHKYDMALFLSTAANLNDRLGRVGPKDDSFYVEDVTGAAVSGLRATVTQHLYYRDSPKGRAIIRDILKGDYNFR